MASLPRAALLALALIGAAALALMSPAAPRAEANPLCDAPVGGLAGGIGIGTPVSDACEKVTGGAVGAALGPLKDAAASLGNGIFAQITAWAADGATWLLGRVAVLAEKTTTPDLLGRGFVRQYRQMAEIAAVMAALMLILAAVESLGRGEGGLLIRVLFVSLPIAAIATSGAYAVVQLAIAACDGFCAAITHSAGADTRHFFAAAIATLAKLGAEKGAAQGAAGSATNAVAVPLFVGFIAAIVAALAAFMVWIELLMRDAAIYAVALFAPFALAASIWPRWSGALRRTAELICVLVFSKFAIIAIIALAASLLANAKGSVEQVLAAAALLAIACFSPFVLLRLVPFAEGAIGSAYSRQGATGASVRTSEIASAHMMRRAALAHWAQSARNREEPGESGRGSPGSGGPKPRPGGSSPGSGGAGGGTGAAASPALAAASGAAKAAGSAGQRAQRSRIAAAASAPSGAPEGGKGTSSTARPSSLSAAASAESGAGGRAGSEPNRAGAGAPPSPSEKPPRPAADLGPAKPDASPEASS